MNSLERVSVPIERWLCGPLREWAEDFLGEKRLRHEGFFEPAPFGGCGPSMYPAGGAGITIFGMC